MKRNRIHGRQKGRTQISNHGRYTGRAVRLAARRSLSASRARVSGATLEA